MSDPSNGSDNVVDLENKSVGSYSMQDLGLLHHFTLHSASTIGAIESELYNDIWRQEVPRLAQLHGFLMHAVLAFAAAHQLSSSDIPPTLRDCRLVRGHYSAALSEFRQAVDVINDERAEALLCFGILTSFLTLFLECVAFPTAGGDFIGRLVIFLRVVQNSTKVIAQVRTSLQSSKIGVLLSHTWKEEPHPIDPEIERSLFVLDSMAHVYISSLGTSPYSDSSGSNTSHTTDLSEGAILLQGLAQLRQLFALTKPKEKGWKFILLWPIKLPPPFIQLVQDSNPIALCALAHWCVPIYHAPQKWFTGDFAERTLEAVAQKLAGTQWEEGIRWPLKATLGESILNNGGAASVRESLYC